MKPFSLLWVGASLFIIASCTPPEEIAKTLDDRFKVDPEPNESIKTGQCYDEAYNTPEEFITRKLDILVIPDTSGSIIEERGAIADGFDAFIDRIPVEVDYQIAVMLGHGSKSSRSGKLYQNKTEPIVLRSRELGLEQIKTYLRKKMMNPHTDGSSDGGEMGLYSLLKILKSNSLVDIRNQLDFFREGAALAIVFVADEQDICAQYPQGIFPVRDPQGLEESSYARDCVATQNGETVLTITPQKVVERLREIQNGMPLVVGGVLYNNLNTIPLVGENELGYGYLETIQLAGGLAVDLANGDYSDGLERLGILATTSLRPQNDFNLRVSPIEEASIKVKVDGETVPFRFDQGLNQVQLLRPRGPFSSVSLHYCQKEEIPQQAIQIATGGFHSCALLVDGSVKCWGRNQFGQLGYGDTNMRGHMGDLTSLPTLDLPASVIQLSAGLYHTCALLEDQNVLCWGANAQGQLGQGHQFILGDDETLSSVPPISLNGRVQKIFSGTFHNCALMTSGSIRCWGDNNDGQLGLGHTDDLGDDELPSSAAPINIGGSATQLDLSTLSSHICALRGDGQVYCWGKNHQGQLGYAHLDTIGDDELPTQAGAVPVDLNHRVLQLSTGNTHTCALLDNGKVKCWGGNDFGQLGQGHRDMIGDDEFPNSIGSISLGSNALQISAGNFSNCALLENAQVLCWGHGSLGKLGQGSEDNIGDDELPSQYAPIPLQDEVAELASGVNHVCARTRDRGQIMCWGHGGFGQLGRGDQLNLGDNEVLSGFAALDLIGPGP